MFTATHFRKVLQSLGGAALLSLAAFGSALAAPLNIKDSPLFLNDTPPPLNMLVMSRDHRLFYEAYNDASDLDGDGDIDTGFIPAVIDYYGYFDSYRCYTYASEKFSPTSTTVNKKCSGASEWSGDWLNYMSMSRIDAMRKVLYGGLRSTDTASETVLQRAFIPQDAHSWGKEYTSFAVNGYDITEYTPLAQPDAGHRHLFANTSPSAGTNVTGNDNPAINGVPKPLFRVLVNRQNNRIWEWVSKERPVAGDYIDNKKYDDTAGSPRCDTSAAGDLLTRGFNATNTNCARTDDVVPNRGAGTLTDYVVRVQVCGFGASDSCKVYPDGNAKPVGLLQEYGENNSMFFGLLTGSYGKPHDGGVLRRPMSSITNEITAANGRFIYTLDPPGIISTIDRLRIMGFSGDSYGCGWIALNADENGNCSMWGNPTAEMMYETLRYFAGKTAAVSDFADSAVNGQETTLGLKKATWDSNTNPYRTTAGGYPVCSKPFQTVISDISPSFDSDRVPGSSFNTYTGDITGMDVSTLGSTIWNREYGTGTTISAFIGQVGTLRDDAPTAKTVGSFSNIRGLAPEAPTKQGSYNAAGVAYFGLINDLANPSSSTSRRVPKVQTFAVAMASPLPSLAIPVGTGTITLVPFAKSVKWDATGITPAEGSYQPTNQIVDFYVETLTSTSGRFRVNFEDVEQGADHDMDAIATYDYTVNADNTLTVTVTSEYAAGGIVQHMGYVVSGAGTQSGTYLVVRDADTASNADQDYFLDTPNTAGVALPLVDTRTFTPGTTGTAVFLKDPLWYAAKWGGFRNDRNNSNFNDIPDQQAEWDADGNGVPDNYFLVTNALRLKTQLTQAFNSILDRSGSASSASVSSGSISDDTRIYQATFDTRNWSGHLIAYPVGTGLGGTTEGALGTMVWDAAEKVPAHNARKILTVLPDAATFTTGILRSGVKFRWATVGSTYQTVLASEDRLNYLRGDSSKELGQTGGVFRKRPDIGGGRVNVLGDIVNSAPVFVGAPSWRYPDSLEPSSPYSEFVTDNLDRMKVVYAGANDGMLHAFDAESGIELFAFIPYGVYPRLNLLSSSAYSHRYYVDGTPTVVDAFFGTGTPKWHTVLVGGLNKGGQSIYALDVTDPENISEDNAATTVMWEFTDRQDADLGYTYSRPAVVKLQNGRWVAIFGNGYNNTVADGYASATGDAALFIVDIADGSVIRKIAVPYTRAGTDPPNGLGTPVVIDRDGNSRADTVYAGDLFGNLWKFDLADSNSANWKIAYTDGANVSTGNPLPLFVAVNANGQRQPITGRPQVGRGPNGQGWMVLFGTGKFLEPSDRDVGSLIVQSFYGIIDRASGTNADKVPRSDLLQQTITTDTIYSYTVGTATMTVPVRVTSANTLSSSHRGWYLDLLSPAPSAGYGFQGEMQVTNPVLRNGRVIFTTLIPDSDICAYGGRSWMMDIDAVSGARLQYSPFDLNRDGQYSQGDYFTLADGTKVPVSGRASDSILTAPAFLSGNQGDYAVTTSSGGNENGENIDVRGSNTGPSGRGRQSWRQLR